MKRQQNLLFIYKYFQNNRRLQSNSICQRRVLDQSLTSINTQVDSKDIESKVEFIKQKFNEIKQSRKINESITEIGDTLNEPRTTIKSILTDFVVEDITLLDSSPILIYILNKLFNGFFDSYRQKTGEDYRLVYKGGNVIKLYFDDLVNNFFDSSLKPEIYTKYGGNFKVSDLDFGVENFNTESKKSKQEQSDEVMPIVWYLLQISRIIILSNMNAIYEFCRFNYLQMEYEIQPILDKTEKSLSNVVKDLQEQLNEYVRDYTPGDIRLANSITKLTLLIQRLNDNKYIGICFHDFVYINQSELMKIFLTNDNSFKFIDTFDEKKNTLIKQGAIPDFFFDGSSDRRDGYNETKYINDFKITSSYFSQHLNVNLFNNNLFNQNFLSIANQVLPNDNDKSELYVTASMNIKTPRSSFSLVRLMMNFLLIYTKDNRLGVINEPSELYDITFTTETKNVISIPKDKKYNHYNYSFLNNQNQIISDTVLIWSAIEIVNDLLGVLFLQFSFPWEDRKYQKRLIRLIFMSNYIEMMYRDGLIAEDIDVNQYTMNTIQIEYVNPVQNRINSMTDIRLQKLYNIEMEKLRETIASVQNDINRYSSRTRIRRNYSSDITSFL